MKYPYLLEEIFPAVSFGARPIHFSGKRSH